ncbi:MAG: adenine deaminase [Pseudomonadota bacterium]
MDKESLGRRIDQGIGREDADLVIKGAGILNVATGEVDSSDIAICGDWIVGTYEGYRGKREIDGRGLTAVPGFIDTHVHVESSLVTPHEFDRLVLPHGTTTAICDPHEIANVLGLEAFRYFLDAAPHLRMTLKVQLSSCVPATHLETSGARLDATDLVHFSDNPSVIGLAEMMNFPGVLAKDPGVLEKLVAFAGQHVDGHIPLVRGYDLNAYLAAGMRTDHETPIRDEGAEKLAKGLQLLIREGSIAKNVAELAPLLTDATWPSIAFCTDDRNPLEIADEGHIDYAIRKAIKHGAPVVATYRAASFAAARAFGLFDRVQIAPGRRADIVLLRDLETCAVEQVICGGVPVDDAAFGERTEVPPVGYRSVKRDPVGPEVFAAHASGPSGPVIGAIQDSLLTNHLTLSLPYRDGCRLPDLEQGVHKLAVLERHGVNGNVGIGFVHGFGALRGALSSSIGHDSHNIIVVGDNDADMALAVNRLIEIQGGSVAAAGGNVLAEVALPVAGLMSDQPYEEVDRQMRKLREATKDMGGALPEPLLQLAFLPLPVIPHLKLTDKGLVDVDKFELIAA